MSVNVAQLEFTLDSLMDPWQPARREPDLEALEDIDLEHADRVLTAELADAVAAGPTPRRCECDRPVGDRDQDGDPYCIRCGHAPPPNGGPP